MQTMGGGDESCMTPKQRMQQRKMKSTEHRKMELRVASIDASSSRHEASARKQHLIFGHDSESPQGGKSLVRALPGPIPYVPARATVLVAC
jgi:hypothetical protein